MYVLCCPQIDNSVEEIADVVNYPDVRIMSGALVTAASPQDDVIMDHNWAVPSPCKCRDSYSEINDVTDLTILIYRIHNRVLVRATNL